MWVTGDFWLIRNFGIYFFVIGEDERGIVLYREYFILRGYMFNVYLFIDILDSSYDILDGLSFFYY